MDTNYVPEDRVMRESVMRKIIVIMMLMVMNVWNGFEWIGGNWLQHSSLFPSSFLLLLLFPFFLSFIPSTRFWWPVLSIFVMDTAGYLVTRISSQNCIFVATMYFRHEMNLLPLLLILILVSSALHFFFFSSWHLTSWSTRNDDNIGDTSHSLWSSCCCRCRCHNGQRVRQWQPKNLMMMRKREKKNQKKKRNDDERSFSRREEEVKVKILLPSLLQESWGEGGALASFAFANLFYFSSTFFCTILLLEPLTWMSLMDIKRGRVFKEGEREDGRRLDSLFSSRERERVSRAQFLFGFLLMSVNTTIANELNRDK